VSTSPPVAAVTTGTPQAMASRDTVPKVGRRGVQTTTTVERSSAGMSW
jgi:hypothetical protein